MKGQKHLTVVIKLGTSSIVHEKTHEPLLSILGLIVETAKKLRRDGHRVVIVSSGAIGVALQLRDLEKRPKSLPAVQALAALGQCKLMSMWDMLFQTARQPVAQILLTRNDIADINQYKNAQNTLFELLKMDVIPIVNENDTLSVAEIKFGDNDTLSAITAAMVHADYLFLMTDVDCLYNTNPRKDPNASPIEVVTDISALVADVSSAGSSLGTGGMGTKITAAKLATAAGVTTIITRSSKPGNVFDIVDYLESVRSGETSTKLTSEDGTTAAVPKPASLPLPPLHTRFLPSPNPMRDRHFWLLHGLAPHGTIYIDQGAHKALVQKAGLFPVGIVDVEGNFSQHEAVRLVVVKRVAPIKLWFGAHTPGLPSRPALPSRPDSGTLTPSSEATSTTTTLAGVSNTDLKSPGLAGYEGSLETEDPMSSSHISTTSTASGHHDMGSQNLLGVAGDTYEKVDPPPREVGRALVNYSALEIARIKGLRSGEIVNVLGYADSAYVALREFIILIEHGQTKKEDEGSGHERKGSKTKIGDLASFG